MGFVHLHLHTEYSLLDGATPIRKLFGRLKELGQEAVAITEHGNMLSFVTKYNLARQHGIKLIFGVEAYIVDDINIKDKNQKRHHLLLLARNYEGFKNLIQLVSDSYNEQNFYYKPRVDMKMLAKHSSGLIATTGCLAAHIPSLLMDNRYDDAVQKAQEYIQIFGKQNYYVELQDHGIPAQKQILDNLIRLSDQLGLTCIATNDVHYLNKDDAFSQEIMLCIQTKKTISDKDRMKFDSNEFYLKTEQEMRERFSQIPQAIDATVQLAQRCDVELELGKPIFPEFSVPDNMTEQEFLRKLCEQGLEQKYQSSSWYDQAKQRMDYELSVINSMGFAKYFLIVQDFIKAAKEFCSVGPGRGSAAGSVVAYILGITQVEPLHLDLLFERFLNPDRISLPDVDIDFGDRDKVLEYVKNKYGEQKVALIGTVGTMQAKAALKDVARAMDIPFSIANEMTQYVTEKTIQASLDAKDAQGKPLNIQLQRYAQQYPKLFEVAMRLEGTVRQVGIHACGVAWGPKPITEYTAVRRQEGHTVIQLDMNEVEELGLVKFDFLGLETLNITRKTLEFIGKDDDWLEQIPLDDPESYAMLRRGESVGVFQLESKGMQRTLKQVNPTCFDDIIAIVALYRPGPMEYLEVYARRKEGREKVTYPHPKAQEILQPTYGIMVYQEQVMKLSVVLAGFTNAQADVLRKAIGKKKLDLMQQMEQKFKKGCIDNAKMTPKSVDALWDDIVRFAAYSFNKSHAAAYALIAYRTAYLKAHYPVEFMASLISSAIRDTDKMSFYLETAKHMGISILPPDINKSQIGFSVETLDTHKVIRFGLSGIKFVGASVLDEIVQKRPFAGFQEFADAVDKSKFNKRVMESLIKAGALGGFGLNRNQLLQCYEQYFKTTAKAGQMTLFGQAASGVDIPQCSPPTLMERLTMEKDVLGVYVTGHPLDEYPQRGGLSSFDDLRDGYQAQVMGIVIDKKQITTRSGETMAFVTIVDRVHRVEIIVFPSLYNEMTRHDMMINSCIYVEGKVDKGKIIADRISQVPKQRL